ncbi:MAG: hypothetical protein VX617_00415, partial [Pseudomonadota bacterium]|nr:hypothetical protein [Pseudomonadota bacterium]
SIPIFWRYAAGFQTRAIDALRHGISILSPENSICRSLLGEHNNLYVTIGTAQGERVAQTRLNSLDSSSLPRFEVSGRDHMNNIFLPSPEREVRLLKFCLFQTLHLSKRTVSRGEQFPTPVELKGYDRETGLKAYTSIIGQNLTNPTEAANFNYAGLAGFYAAIISEDNQRLGNLSIRLFKEGILRFPNNAIIRFNFSQVLWVFSRLNEAQETFQELNVDDNLWQFDPKSDAILSHRVRQLARMFPYSDYYRAVENWGTKSIDAVRPLDMIFSATKVYLACIDREVGDGRKSISLLDDAIRLCPNNFAAYREKVTLISDTTNDISSLLKAFYAAVNLYPPVLLELFSYGIDGEVSRGNITKARDLIKKFVLFYSRSLNADLKSIKIPLQTKAALRRHLSLLSGWHRSIGEEIIKSSER